MHGRMDLFKERGHSLAPSQVLNIDQSVVSKYPTEIKNNPGVSYLVEDFVNAYVNAFIGGAIVGGKIDLENALGQALGSYIGQEAGNGIKNILPVHPANTIIGVTDDDHLLDYHVAAVGAIPINYQALDDRHVVTGVANEDLGDIPVAYIKHSVPLISSHDYMITTWKKNWLNEITAE